MASSTFRSATVEEYDEDPGDNGAHGGASPHAEGNVDLVSSIDCCPHARELQDLPQSVIQIQSTRQYPPEAHQRPPSHGYDDVDPPPPQLPAAPTPPLNPRPKKPKVKSSLSSRRRSKDCPEYYGIRDTTTAVAPAIPVNPGWTSNSRIARRPTTAWHVSGSQPIGAGPVGPTVDPPARVRRLPDNSDRSPPAVPPANAFRASGATRERGYQPSSDGQIDRDDDWGTPETHARGLETLHANVGTPHYPTAQQQNPRGMVMPPRGRCSKPSDLGSQASGIGMDSRCAQSPSQPSQLQSPAQHNPLGPVVLSSNGKEYPNTPDEGLDPPSYTRRPPIDDERHLPQRPPVSQDPHGLIVLSSNSSQSTHPPNEALRQPDIQIIPQPRNERRSSPPPNHRPAPRHDCQMGVPQHLGYRNYGRQSVPPAQVPPAQPSNSNDTSRGNPSLHLACGTPNSHPNLQRLSLEDAPLEDRVLQQVPPHARTGQFRSQDTPRPSHTYANSTSYKPTINTPRQERQAPIRQLEAYPARIGSGRYAPHPQRRYPDEQDPSLQHGLINENPAATASGNWPQWASKTPHPQQLSHNYNPNQGTSRRPPPSSVQAGCSLKTPRYGPTTEVYYPKDNYYEPDEDFESSIHGPSSRPTRNPGDTPTLPEGHPFLRMKDIALTAILKEFRAWQASGAPGRRGPHSRRAPFSCPFAKKNPLRYKDCFSDTLPSIPDVKEHVSLYHAIPIYCPRCMELFDDEGTRDDHIRHADCPSQQLSRPSGVTESQKRQLQNIPTYLPPQDQWTNIFLVIFPRLQAPESPYVDESLHEDVLTYRDFIETRGPRALSDVLTFRGAATWNLSNEERDLAAFKCLMLEEGVRDLVGQWARRGASDSHRSPSTSVAGPLTPSTGSFASSKGQLGRAYTPSHPVETHHWEPRPRIRGDDWGEFGDGPVRNASSDGRAQEIPLYPISRRKQALHYE